MLNISNNKDTDFLDEGEFYSLRTLKTPGMGRLLAKVLLAIVGISIIVMFLPWQQNIRGTGTLTAFANFPFSMRGNETLSIILSIHYLKRLKGRTQAAVGPFLNTSCSGILTEVFTDRLLTMEGILYPI